MDSQMINKPFKLLTLMPSLFYSTCIPAFPSGSCPLWHTSSLRSSASAVCSRRRWRGSARGSPDGRASASESLWLGCLCPLGPRTLWCCHQETRRSPWGDTLKFNNCVLKVYKLKDCKKNTYLIPDILRLFLSSKPMDWKKHMHNFMTWSHWNSFKLIHQCLAFRLTGVS